MVFERTSNGPTLDITLASSKLDNVQQSVRNSAPDALAAKASDAASLLKSLANEQRLLILCHLVSEGEMKVGDLGDRLDLSQSALSQHLARLREQKLVAFRRESQTLFYRVADPKAEQVLELLRDLFCPELKPSGKKD